MVIFPRIAIRFGASYCDTISSLRAERARFSQQSNKLVHMLTVPLREGDGRQRDGRKEEKQRRGMWRKQSMMQH